MRTLLTLLATAIMLAMANPSTFTFPLTTKVAVSGAQAHPFYLWAREALGAANAPSWNFHKYLIGRDGKLIAGYGARVEPLSLELTRGVEAALAAP